MKHKTTLALYVTAGTLLCVFSAAALLAGPPLKSCSTLRVLLPPAEFDHLPAIPVITEQASKADIKIICEALGGSAADRACTFLSPTPVIYLPALGEDTELLEQACLRRHEEGHVNSRSDSHEGWRR